jgi:energy-coupling factor transporter ATP-binding protein EcfA2
MELLKTLGRNRTIVISGHDLDLMKLCDRTYLMRDGRIIGEIKNRREIFQDSKTGASRR